MRSFRRLCAAISEDLAFRSFCFLTICDEVFNHSTIRYFIERVDNEGSRQIFQQFNEELLRLGLLSRQTCADSSLVRAKVRGRRLSPSGTSKEEFKDKATEENGLFVLRERTVGEHGEERGSSVITRTRRDDRAWVPWTPTPDGEPPDMTGVRICIAKRTR